MVDAVKVVVRVRPLIQREKQQGSIIKWSIQDDLIKQLSDTSPRQYLFDKVFSPKIDNLCVYNEVARPILEDAMAGFNGTVFAYGQTSSGKTYTMMGDEKSPGIVPLITENIYQWIEKCPDREFLVRVSYMEIYNEGVTDLLGEDNKKLLDVRERPDGEVFVKNLQEEVVTDSDMIQCLLKRGEDRRHFAATNMNERSSRSHVIIKLIIESREKDSDGSVQVAHLNLVDLAGSEKAKQTQAKGQRLVEGGFINKSLFHLTSVIKQLSEKREFISYRDSKLTRILQNSLGGNSKTAIICNITPACVSLEETHSTLRFAQNAKCIQNKPIVNEVLSDEAMLRRYKSEINKLQEELKQVKGMEVSQIHEKNQELQKQLLEKQEKIDKLTKLFSVSSTLPQDGGNKSSFHIKAKRRETWCPGKSLNRKSSTSEVPSLTSTHMAFSSFNSNRSDSSVAKDGDTKLSSVVTRQLPGRHSGIVSQQPEFRDLREESFGIAEEPSMLLSHISFDDLDQNTDLFKDDGLGTSTETCSSKQATATSPKHPQQTKHVQWSEPDGHSNDDEASDACSVDIDARTQANEINKLKKTIEDLQMGMDVKTTLLDDFGKEHTVLTEELDTVKKSYEILEECCENLKEENRQLKKDNKKLKSCNKRLEAENRNLEEWKKFADEEAQFKNESILEKIEKDEAGSALLASQEQLRVLVEMTEASDSKLVETRQQLQAMEKEKYELQKQIDSLKSELDSAASLASESTFFLEFEQKKFKRRETELLQELDRYKNQLSETTDDVYVKDTTTDVTTDATTADAARTNATMADVVTSDEAAADVNSEAKAKCADNEKNYTCSSDHSAAVDNITNQSDTMAAVNNATCTLEESALTDISLNQRAYMSADIDDVTVNSSDMSSLQAMMLAGGGIGMGGCKGFGLPRELVDCSTQTVEPYPVFVAADVIPVATAATAAATPSAIPQDQPQLCNTSVQYELSTIFEAPSALTNDVSSTLGVTAEDSSSNTTSICNISTRLPQSETVNTSTAVSQPNTADTNTTLPQSDTTDINTTLPQSDTVDTNTTLSQSDTIDTSITMSQTHSRDITATVPQSDNSDITNTMLQADATVSVSDISRASYDAAYLKPAAKSAEQTDEGNSFSATQAESSNTFLANHCMVMSTYDSDVLSAEKSLHAVNAEQSSLCDQSQSNIINGSNDGTLLSQCATFNAAVLEQSTVQAENTSVRVGCSSAVEYGLDSKVTLATSASALSNVSVCKDNVTESVVDNSDAVNISMHPHQQQYPSVEELQAALNKLQHQLACANSDKEEMSNEMDTMLDQVLDLQSKLEVTEKELQDAKGSIAAHDREQIQIGHGGVEESTVEAITDKYNKLENNLQLTLQKCENYEKTVTQLKQELREAQAQAQTTNSLQGLSGYTSAQSLIEITTRAQRAESQADIAQHQNKLLQQQYQELKDEIKLLEDINAKHDRLEHHRGSVDPERLKDQIKKMAVRQDITDQRCQNYEIKISALKDAVNKSEAVTFERNSLQQQVRELQQVVLTKDEEQKHLRQCYESYCSEVNQNKLTIAKLQADIQKYRQDIARLEKDISELSRTSNNQSNNSQKERHEDLHAMERMMEEKYQVLLSEELQAKEEELRKAFEAVETLEAKLDDTKRTLNIEHEKEIKLLTEQHERLLAEASKLQSGDDIQTDVVEIKKSLLQLQASCETLDRDKQKLKNQLKQLQVDHDNLTAIKQHLQQKLDEKCLDYQQLLTSYQDLETLQCELEKLEKQHNLLSAENEHLKMTQEQLKNENMHSNDLKEETEVLRHQKEQLLEKQQLLTEELEKQQAALSAEMENLLVKQEELKKEKDRGDAASAELVLLQTKVEELEKQNDLLVAESEVFMEKQQEFNDERDLLVMEHDNMTEQYNELAARHDELKLSLAELTELAADHEELKARYAELTELAADHEELKARYAELTEQHINLEAKLQQAKLQREVVQSSTQDDDVFAENDTDRAQNENLSAAEHSSEKLMKEECEKQATEIQELKEELKAKLNRCSQCDAYKHEIAALDIKCNQLTSEHDEEMAKVKEEQQKLLHEFDLLTESTKTQDMLTVEEASLLQSLHSEEIEDMRNKLKAEQEKCTQCHEYQCRISSLKSELQWMKDEVDKEDEEIETLKKENEESAAKIERLKKENEEVQAERERLKDENEAANAEIEKLRTKTQVMLTDEEVSLMRSLHAEEIEDLKNKLKVEQEKCSECREYQCRISSLKCELQWMKDEVDKEDEEIEILKKENEESVEEIERLKKDNDTALVEIEKLKREQTATHILANEQKFIKECLEVDVANQKKTIEELKEKLKAEQQKCSKCKGYMHEVDYYKRECQRLTDIVDEEDDEIEALKAENEKMREERNRVKKECLKPSKLFTPLSDLSISSEPNEEATDSNVTTIDTDGVVQELQHLRNSLKEMEDKYNQSQDQLLKLQKEERNDISSKDPYQHDITVRDQAVHARKYITEQLQTTRDRLIKLLLAQRSAVTGCTCQTVHDVMYEDMQEMEKKHQRLRTEFFMTETALFVEVDPLKDRIERMTKQIEELNRQCINDEKYERRLEAQVRELKEELDTTKAQVLICPKCNAVPPKEEAVLVENYDPSSIATTYLISQLEGKNRNLTKENARLQKQLETVQNDLKDKRKLIEQLQQKLREKCELLVELQKRDSAKHPKPLQQSSVNKLPYLPTTKDYDEAFERQFRNSPGKSQFSMFYKD